MKVGDKVSLGPTTICSVVGSLQIHHHEYKEVYPGDHIGLSLRGVGVKEIERGFVLCDTIRPGNFV